MQSKFKVSLFIYLNSFMYWILQIFFSGVGLTKLWYRSSFIPVFFLKVEYSFFIFSTNSQCLCDYAKKITLLIFVFSVSYIPVKGTDVEKLGLPNAIYRQVLNRVSGSLKYYFLIDSISIFSSRR